ncbi:MAG: helix-turn-helix domain-containing protein [Thermodesulfobacteriota bacterium]
MNPAEEKEKQECHFLYFKTLYEIARIINSALSIEEAFPQVLRVLAKQMGINRGGIIWWNLENNKWEIGATHGISGEEMKRRKDYFSQNIIETLMEKGQMAAILNKGADIWFYDARAKNMPLRVHISFLCAPIKIQGTISAIIGVDHLFAEPIKITEDFLLLEKICQLIADGLKIRKAMAAEARALLEENWIFRKELEALGKSVQNGARKIPLTEILEERISRMITEMKVDPRSNGHLYEDVIKVVERTLLSSALEKTKYVQSQTARFLGINRNTLRRKMKELGIGPQER